MVYGRREGVKGEGREDGAVGLSCRSKARRGATCIEGRKCPEYENDNRYPPLICKSLSDLARLRSTDPVHDSQSMRASLRQRFSGPLPPNRRLPHMQTRRHRTPALSHPLLNASTHVDVVGVVTCCARLIELRHHECIDENYLRTNY